MQRLIALLVMLMFAVATTATGSACQAPKKCCCKPAANSLCAPDCCEGGAKAPPSVELSAQPALIVFALPSAHLFVRTPVVVNPSPASLVGLHQRAAPRLPLRV